MLGRRPSGPGPRARPVFGSATGRPSCLRHTTPALQDGSPRPGQGSGGLYTAVSVTRRRPIDPEIGGVVVSEVTTATPEIVDALSALVPQLSSSAPAPTMAEIADIAPSPATVLLIARDHEGTIVGSLTLVVFRAPTGPRAWIEDVVVDTGTRGQGIGAALVHEALDRAGSSGARTVDLTSRPSREAANRLYLRLGFAQRQTNVYRWNHVPHEG
jgi:GNAT superfamily N-acetyltransferase